MRPATKSSINIRCDVSQAYIKSSLEPIPRKERRLVQFPSDISPKCESGRNKKYRLTKSLYGMHSAGKMWEKALAAHLAKTGLVRNPRDPCLWRLPDGTMHIAVYVDDICARGDRTQVEWLVKMLTSEHGDVKPQPLDFAPGVHVEEDKHGMLGIHSRSCMEGMLEKEKMSEIKTRPSPCQAQQ